MRLNERTPVVLTLLAVLLLLAYVAVATAAPGDGPAPHLRRHGAAARRDGPRSAAFFATVRRAHREEALRRRWRNRLARDAEAGVLVSFGGRCAHRDPDCPALRGGLAVRLVPVLPPGFRLCRRCAGARPAPAREVAR